MQIEQTAIGIMRQLQHFADVAYVPVSHIEGKILTAEAAETIEDLLEQIGEPNSSAEPGRRGPMMTNLIESMREELAWLKDGRPDCWELVDQAIDRLSMLEDALRRGVEMRAWQRQYFDRRDRDTLVAAKVAEKAFDDLAMWALGDQRL
jgi:hypothetical protein